MLRLLVYLHSILNDLEVSLSVNKSFHLQLTTINSLKYKLPAFVLVVTYHYTIMKKKTRNLSVLFSKTMDYRLTRHYCSGLKIKFPVQIILRHIRNYL